MEPRRSEIDHHPILRPLKAGVDQSTLDAVGTLADGSLRHADEHGLRKCCLGDIDFNLDGKRVDAQQRIGRKFGQHGLPRKDTEKVSTASESQTH